MTTNTKKALDEALKIQEANVNTAIEQLKYAADSNPMVIAHILYELNARPEDLKEITDFKNLYNGQIFCGGWDLLFNLEDNISEIISYLRSHFTLDEITEAAQSCPSSYDTRNIMGWLEQLDKDETIANYINSLTENGGLDTRNKDEINSMINCLYEYPMADAIRNPDLKCIVETIYSILEENGWEEEIESFNNSDLYAVLQAA